MDGCPVSVTEGLPLSGIGGGGFLGGRAHGFYDFGVGFVQKISFPFRATRASALTACACAAALCLVDLNFACGLRLCRFAHPLPLGLRLLALLAAGGATRLGGVFVLVGSFFLSPEVSLPLPPRPSPAVLEIVFVLLLTGRAVRLVAFFSHFPRAQKIQSVHLYVSSELGVGGVFRDV